MEAPDLERRRFTGPTPAERALGLRLVWARSEFVVPPGERPGLEILLVNERYGRWIDDRGEYWAVATVVDLTSREPISPLERVAITGVGRSYDLGPGEAVALPAPLRVASTIVDELQADDRARARGQMRADDLDAHGGLMRLKIAALLAILHGRLDISDEDWRLAGHIKARSDAVRSEVLELTRATEERHEDEYRDKLGGRAVHVEEAKEAARVRQVVDCARKIGEKVHSRPGDCTVAKVRRSMSTRQLGVFDDALPHALAEEWVIEDEEPSHTGNPKRVLRPGRPAQ